MDERLKQQLEFVLEIDKEKIFSARPICPVMAETKTMRNTHGIWRSWRICCGNTPTSRWISDG